MSADNPAGLISTTAIQSQGRSFLFYSRPDATLGYLKSESGNPDTIPLYKPNSIYLDGNFIFANKKSPQIAAVSYRSYGRAEIRVYYISDAGNLQELCQTDGADWYIGSLNAAEIRASPKSLLTASVNNDADGQLQLRVFYNRDGDSMTWCAWPIPPGGKAWANKKINDKY